LLRYVKWIDAAMYQRWENKTILFWHGYVEFSDVYIEYSIQCSILSESRRDNTINVRLHLFQTIEIFISCSCVKCYSIFSFICMFCRSLFVLLYFFFWPLYCLFFFDIRIMIAPLVSSNSPYYKERYNLDLEHYILFYYCLLLRELFSYSVVWWGIVPEPTAKALYL
jgi:hypothetical protein